jgi:hypothetical protein
MKRCTTMLGALALVGALVGCAPPPEAEPQITCDGMFAVASVTPGVTFEPRHQLFNVLAESGFADCSGPEDLGITSGSFDSFHIVFPALDCSGTGAEGAGAGSIRWSDGSTSELLAPSVEMQGPLSARIDLRVVGGTFEGATGGITVDATPMMGDCVEGITSEAFSGGVLTLR